MLREIDRPAASGYATLVVLPILTIAVGVGLVNAVQRESAPLIVAMVVLTIILAIAYGGFFMVNPNETRVLQLFGAYAGSVKKPGLRYANPFLTKRRVSLRVRNFETEKLKVNDENGNPIEIAAVVVWRVVDSAEALFEVDDFEEYVRVQSEAALRGLATQYPYDAHGDEKEALSSNLGAVAKRLQDQIQARLDKAGVQVMEARISHLAYAPEIASAMLQRQQADAIIAARTKIVEGAVGMVHMALDSLARQNIVTLDDERKAAMVSNLLVVLCGDRAPQPVVNTGTLYQ